MGTRDHSHRSDVFGRKTVQIRSGRLGGKNSHSQTLVGYVCRRYQHRTTRRHLPSSLGFIFDSTSRNPSRLASEQSGASQERVGNRYRYINSYYTSASSLNVCRSGTTWSSTTASSAPTPQLYSYSRQSSEPSGTSHLCPGPVPAIPLRSARSANVSSTSATATTCSTDTAFLGPELPTILSELSEIWRIFR